MKLYESRLSYFSSVHQHGGPSRRRQNCHSCIFETKENSNLRICIQYLGHYSKTTCQKSAKSMWYRVRPKFEFYRKSLLMSKTWEVFAKSSEPEAHVKKARQTKNTKQDKM